MRLPKRFSAFIITQSLGAFNDNFFKMLLQLFVLQILVSADAEGIISQATFLFTIPFVLFGPWSGYLADKYSKISVMRIVKFAEIAVMLLGVLAFYLSNLNLMMIVLFLMAAQSTFFSPAKYGYIPEACSPEVVTKANGWVEMTTFMAIILGTVVTGLLLTYHNNNTFSVMVYCVVIAVLGSVSVLFIRDIPAKKAEGKFPWNPLSGIYKDLRFLKRQKPLFLAALANSYFWMLGLIFQTNILIYGKNMLAENGSMSAEGSLAAEGSMSAEGSSNILLALLPAFIGIGIAAGSLLASRLSGNKVELGLVPLGGIGMAFSGIVLYFTASSYLITSFILFLAGVCGGLYIIPLYAYLQFYSKENEKGRVMASAGILNGIFLVLGALVYHILAVELALSPPTNYLIMGILTCFAVVYICTVIPEYFVRFLFWLLTHVVYRIKIIGLENIPFRGPALLAPNHVSYLDAFLIGATVQRFIRFIMLRKFFDLPVFKNLFKLMNSIPIDPGEGSESVTESLQMAKEQLQNDHVVCIFPEGKITRDGEMNEFRPGFETVMAGLDCPVIPVYLSNVWGRIISPGGGKIYRNLFKKNPGPITIEFGKPLKADVKASELEAAVRLLGGERADGGMMEWWNDGAMSNVGAKGSSPLVE